MTASDHEKPANAPRSFAPCSHSTRNRSQQSNFRNEPHPILRYNPRHSGREGLDLPLDKLRKSKKKTAGAERKTRGCILACFHAAVVFFPGG